MTRPSIPKALYAKQLQEICMACGLAKSPPKNALLSRIQIAAKDYKPLAQDARILSIDLGIRNMAFCIIRPRNPAPVPPGDKRTVPFRYPSAHVDVWKRLSLSVRDTVGDDGKDDIPNTISEVTKGKKEDFSPAYMAQMALSFVQTHILPQKPTHILIERQRFRSSSSPAILDWTIRVNMLEAMIYSTLAVYQSNGAWKGEVIPVAPRRVGTFLLEDNQYTAGTLMNNPGNTLENTKKRKIELLGRIIQDRELLHFNDPEAEKLGGSIMLESARLREVKDDGLRGTYERLAKVDDLTDCLLQGLAWLEWQRNTGDLIKNQALVSSLKQAEIELEGDVKDDESDLSRKIKAVKSTAAKGERRRVAKRRS